MIDRWDARAMPASIFVVPSGGRLLVAKATVELSDTGLRWSAAQEPLYEKPEVEPGGRLIRPADIHAWDAQPEVVLVAQPKGPGEAVTVRVAIGRRSEEVVAHPAEARLVRLRMSISDEDLGAPLVLEHCIDGAPRYVAHLPYKAPRALVGATGGPSITRQLELRGLFVDARARRASLTFACLLAQRSVGSTSFVLSFEDAKEVALISTSPARGRGTDDPVTLDDAIPERPAAIAELVRRATAARTTPGSALPPTPATPQVEERPTRRSPAHGNARRAPVWIDPSYLSEVMRGMTLRRGTERAERARAQIIEILTGIDRPVTMAELVRAGTVPPDDQPTIAFVTDLFLDPAPIERVRTLAQLLRAVPPREATETRVAEALRVADSLLHPCLEPASPLLSSHASLLDHLLREHSGTGYAELAATAELCLLERRAVRRIDVMGERCAALELRLDRFRVPLYLPEAALATLPMLPICSIRLLASIVTRQEIAANTEISLKALALVAMPTSGG